MHLTTNGGGGEQRNGGALIRVQIVTILCVLGLTAALLLWLESPPSNIQISFND